MKNKEPLPKNNCFLPIKNYSMSKYRIWPSRLASKPCFGKTKTLASATLRRFRFTLFIAWIMTIPTIDKKEKRNIRFTLRINGREEKWGKLAEALSLQDVFSDPQNYSDSSQKTSCLFKYEHEKRRNLERMVKIFLTSNQKWRIIIKERISFFKAKRKKQMH